MEFVIYYFKRMRNQEEETQKKPKFPMDKATKARKIRKLFNMRKINMRFLHGEEDRETGESG